MGREFTKNTGNLMEVGTNAIGPLLHGASAISLHCWAFMGSNTDGNFDNNFFQSGVGAAVKAVGFSVDGPSNFGGLRAAFSSSAAAGEDRQAAGASTLNSGSWQSVGMVGNFATNKVQIYLNGSLDADASVSAFANTTYVHTTATGCTDRIGCGFATSPTTAQQIAGRVAELAIWTVDIGAAGFGSLSKGFAPTLILPWNLLAVYFPLIGQYSPEIDLRNGRSGTITGSVPAGAHARIFYPRRNMTATAGSASPPSGVPVKAMHQYRLRAG